MNRVDATHYGDAARCTKVKELLKRFNMTYEERREGNTVIIDIKAKPLGHGFPKAQFNSGNPKD